MPLHLVSRIAATFSRHKVLCLIIAIVVAVLSGVLLVQWYNACQFEKHWALVQPSMSKAEVQALLGPPQKIWGRGTTGWLTLNSYEEWAWGHRRLLTTYPSFPYIGPAIYDRRFGPEPDDHVISFSTDGKVIEKAYPYQKPGVDFHLGERL